MLYNEILLVGVVMLLDRNIIVYYYSIQMLKIKRYNNRRYGVCEACGRIVSVRPDGRLWFHCSPTEKNRWMRKPCSGVHSVPYRIFTDQPIDDAEVEVVSHGRR